MARPSETAEARSKALAEKAHAEFRVGNVQIAARLFAEAVQENESNGWALLRHAIALERSAQRREAVDVYRRALAAEWPALEGKEVAIAHNNLGLQLYEVMGEEASAELHYRESMRVAEAHGLSFWYPYKASISKVLSILTSLR